MSVNVRPFQNDQGHGLYKLLDAVVPLGIEVGESEALRAVKLGSRLERVCYRISMRKQLRE